MTRRRRPILLGLLAAGLPALAPAWGANAQDRVSVRIQPYAAPALGQVVRGTADTTFSISSSGVVRRVSGDAVRLSSAPATPPTVVVDCHGRCERPLRIRVQPGGDGASVVRLRATDLQGGVIRSDAAAEGATLVLEVDPTGGASVSFVLEMEIRVRAEGAGPQPINYIVTVDML